MLPSEAATEIVALRREVYGHPAQVYTIWGALLSPIIARLTAEERIQPNAQECAVMLILLKVAREINMGYPWEYRDNADDIAGYANVLHLVKEYRSGPEPDAEGAPLVEGEELPTADDKRRSSGNGRRTRGAKPRTAKVPAGNKGSGRRKRS